MRPLYMISEVGPSLDKFIRRSRLRTPKRGWQRRLRIGRKRIERKTMEKQNQSELELLQVLAESESDVAAGRVAPIEDTFRDLRLTIMNTIR